MLTLLQYSCNNSVLWTYRQPWRISSTHRSSDALAYRVTIAHGIVITCRRIVIARVYRSEPGQGSPYTKPHLTPPSGRVIRIGTQNASQGHVRIECHGSAEEEDDDKARCNHSGGNEFRISPWQTIFCDFARLFLTLLFLVLNYALIVSLSIK